MNVLSRLRRCGSLSRAVLAAGVRSGHRINQGPVRRPVAGDSAVAELIGPPSDAVAGVALNDRHRPAADRLHDAGVADLAGLVGVEDLVARLRVSRMEVPGLLVVGKRERTPGARRSDRLEDDLPADLRPEGSHEAPVDKDVAPHEPLFRSVVEIPQPVEVPRVLGVVPAARVGLGIVQAGAADLLAVPDLVPCDGQDDIDRGVLCHVLPSLLGLLGRVPLVLVDLRLNLPRQLVARFDVVVRRLLVAPADDLRRGLQIRAAFERDPDAPVPVHELPEGEVDLHVEVVELAAVVLPEIPKVELPAVRPVVIDVGPLREAVAFLVGAELLPGDHA